MNGTLLGFTVFSNASEGDTRNTSGLCLNQYSEGPCLHTLQSIAVCESPGSENENVYISNSVVDQYSAEKAIGKVIFALNNFIEPSAECRSAVIPFLCLYTFGACGENSDDYRPTEAQCMEIRDNICESEWKTAAQLLDRFGQPPLPDCSTLGQEGLDCDGKVSCTLTMSLTLIMYFLQWLLTTRLSVLSNVMIISTAKTTSVGHAVIDSGSTQMSI